MAAKELAKKVIAGLPAGATIDDIMHALYVRAKFDRGLEEIRRGRGIPHEEAKRRLKKWVE